MTRARDLSVFIGVLTTGVVVSLIFGLGEIVAQPGYLITVTVLLAVGLLGSTSQVSIDELRRNGGRVVLAVSAGVVAKAAIISGIMFLIFREPAYLVLGVVVAQIDPLANAADRGTRRLSARARSLLSAWASFDDPVTTLLAVYLSAIVLAHTGGSGTGPVAGPGSFWAFAGTLAANALLAGAAFLAWHFFLRRTARPATGGRHQLTLQIVAVAVLAGLVVVGVAEFWMLSVALIGLFFRPALAMRFLPLATRAAFLVAAFALGIALVDGVNVVAGLVLGVAAYVAQIVVGLLVTTGLPIGERVHIALGQQNGITAIILALVLEPSFPGTIGVVAPAILVINLLHAGANAVWERIPSTGPPPPPVPAAPSSEPPVSAPTRPARSAGPAATEQSKQADSVGPLRRDRA
jgi:hypothetical protein